jgi:hypothetical protein
LWIEGSHVIKVTGKCRRCLLQQGEEDSSFVRDRKIPPTSGIDRRLLRQGEEGALLRQGEENASYVRDRKMPPT